MKENKLTTIAKAPTSKQNIIQLKLTTTNGDKMQFAWGATDNGWNIMNKGQAIDAAYLSPWNRGVRTGLTVKCAANTTATFD